MENENPSIISHVSIGTNDLARSVAFYDAVLPVLGCRKLFEYPGAVAYGKRFPELWVQTPIDGKASSIVTVAEAVSVTPFPSSSDAVTVTVSVSAPNVPNSGSPVAWAMLTTSWLSKSSCVMA